MNYQALLEFCKTDRQKQIFNSMIKEGSQVKAAKALGIDIRNVERAVQKVKLYATQRGTSPEHGLNRLGPDGYKLKGFSDMRENVDGKPIWYKFTEDSIRQAQIMQETVLAMKDQILPIQIPEPDKIKRNQDLIPWFQIGDAHINMLAHKYEVGHKFDITIAERELCKAFQIAVDECPAADRCVINDLGDFQHIDNLAGVTTKSGNLLDKDQGFSEMVRVTRRIMQYIILSCLKKFKFVDVIINQGNHNDTGAIWMAEMLRCRFQTKRVHILDNSDEFIPYRMGNTFVVTSHGQNCKPSAMAALVAEYYHHDFAESMYCYIDTGHIHHKEMSKEFAGVIWQSWNTMAPTDKHAHSKGYRSRSFLSVALRYKTYGQCGLNTIPVERVKDLLDKVPAGTEAKKRTKVYTV